MYLLSNVPTQVPDRLLPPNLHIAVCRFERQEMQRGLIADDTEMWVERGMNGPKQLARRALHAEITWVKATQSIKRALLRCKVEHGCLTPAEAKAQFKAQGRQGRDPAAAAEERPYFKYTGTMYRGTEATLPAGLLSIAHCGAAVLLVCQRAKQLGMAGWEDQQVDTWNEDDYLDHVCVTTFRECQLHHCLASSPLRGESDRVTASSWFEARMGGDVSLVQTLSFVLLQLKGQPNARALRLAVVIHCQQWVRNDLAGSACYVAPASAEVAKRSRLLDVARLKFPCVLIKPSSADCSELRLMPLYEKFV
jgi:hypothetical protein